jgi:hypothetical protein
MSRYNTVQTHPLILREQNYLLQKKLISFHSEDRDVKQWPKTNHFQINLPASLSQVQSMRLINISLPSNQYVFSNSNQNTKFSFTISSSINEIPQSLDVEISEGTYDPEELALEIQNKMNYALLNVPELPNQIFFKCKYNKSTNAFWFGKIGTINPTITKFSLDFHKKMNYDTNCDLEVWDKSTNWGFPYYLGYQKKKYISEKTPPNLWFGGVTGGPFGFDYEITDPSSSDEYWLTEPTGNLFVDISKNPCMIDIKGHNWIYMEMGKYNSMDEIKPNSTNTNASFNNDYNGKVNSAFAKIPIGEKNFGSTIFVKSRNLMSNISYFTPPLSRINVLQFKFRYHDGRLVDFKCLPVSFVIEFNLLCDEPSKKMNVIVPPQYYHN